MTSRTPTFGSALLVSAIALAGLLVGLPQRTPAADVPQAQCIDVEAELAAAEQTPTTVVVIEPGEWIVYDEPIPYGDAEEEQE